MTGAAAGWCGETTPLALWLIAAVADAILATVPGLDTVLSLPLDAVRGLGRWLDRRLNRPRRDAATRRIRGLVVALFVLGLGWLAGAAVDRFVGGLPHGWPIEALAVLSLLGQGRVIGRLRGVGAALSRDDPARARARLAPLVRFDAAALDAHGLARGAVEASAARLTEGLVGAAFWFVLLGLPGLAAYRALNALAQAIGRDSARLAAFGAATRRLDALLTLPPALIAGPLFVLAAIFTASARPVGAFAAWLADLKARPAEAAGRAEGAVAGALGLALGGPRPHDGKLIAGGWIGDGRARATGGDVRRAAWLAATAALILAAAMAAAVVSICG